MLGVGEGLRFEPAAGGKVETAAISGVDDPDIAYSHPAVVLEPLEIAIDAVLGREDFNDGDGRGLNDLFAWGRGGQHADVGDAEAGGRDLNAEFGEGAKP